MATLQELQAYAQNPNVRKMLDVIAQAEGTTGYDTAFGGGKLTALTDHPRKLYDFTQTDGKADKTSAAGRYQFLQGTWDDVAGKLGLKDFGPESQDIAAIELLSRAGALEPVLSGDFKTAVDRSGSTWASLPSSPYAQPKRSPGFIANALNKAAEMAFPAAQAGTLDDEWAALESQFRQGGQPAEAAPQENDPWAELELQFAPPKAGDVMRVEMAHEGPNPNAAPQAAPPIQSPVQSEASGLGGEFARQIGLTARAGINGLTALPSMLWNGPVDVINQYAGTNIPRSDWSGAMDAVGLPKPANATERVAGDVASAMAGTGGAMKLGQTLMKSAEPVIQAVTPTIQRLGSMLSSAPGAQIASAAGSAGAGGTARELGFGPGVQLGAALAGGLAGGTAVNAIDAARMRATQQSSVPTTQALRQQSADLFSDAERNGVTATQEQTRKLAEAVRNTATNEGLISPTGRVSEAYPKAREALRMLDDYAEGTMNVPQMQAIRKTLADAAGSPDSGERRIASMMLNQFDDFTSPLAPQLREGRALWTRAMRGEQLETLHELAGSRAGQFSGSGFENALRTEYRQLNNKIIKGQERGWSQEQAEAIRRVAEGTRLANALRNFGRLAPTGSVSFMASGGVPFGVGVSMGGVGLGSAMAGGMMGGSYLARDAATRLTRKSAQLAELLARNGGELPTSTDPNAWAQILGATLQGQAALQSGK